ncbi:cytochrome P450 [Schizophyllum commune]
MSLTNSGPILLSALAGIAVYLLSRRRRDALPLPPGPKKLPLVGNLFDMPNSFEWERYMEWAKEFGTDIIHLDVAGKSIVVLDTYEAAIELLEKRSKDYSDRPAFPMTIDLMGIDYNFSLIWYGEHGSINSSSSRARRRLVHGALGPTAVANYQPLELKMSHSFLRAMRTASENDLEAELRLWAAQLTLGIAYGLDIQSRDDPHVTEAGELVRMVTETCIQGSYLVNSIPTLKYVPEWMPGAGFKRVAREGRAVAHDIVHRPFREVKESLSNGAPRTPSFAFDALANGADDIAIRDAAATMYNAGTDTTVVTLLNFTLAMLDNPKLQRRAQDELDGALGPLQTAEGMPGQMPTFAHEPQLPYITMLVRETLRYMPAGPVVSGCRGVAHAYSGAEADIYKGYAIPSGSIVIPNVWSMMHNETIYPDSYSYKPERFSTPEGELDPHVRDPANIAFGFGRRICLGRHLAYNSIWIMIASILRVYNIEKAEGADGKSIEPRREWASSLIMCPKKFECAFVPRSEQAAKMIQATAGLNY